MDHVVLNIFEMTSLKLENLAMSQHKLYLPPSSNRGATSTIAFKMKAKGFGCQIFGINRKARIFPMFPPKPTDWAAGNLRSATCANFGYETQRFQGCADKGGYGRVSGDGRKLMAANTGIVCFNFGGEWHV